jgi:hypothetical protein
VRCCSLWSHRASRSGGVSGTGLLPERRSWSRALSP